MHASLDAFLILSKHQSPLKWKVSREENARKGMIVEVELSRVE